MDRATRLIFIFLGCAAVFFGFLLLAFERIPVRTYGVKQYVWAGGIQPQDYTAGFCFGVTGIHVFHLLDASTHFLEFTEGPGREGLGKARGSSFIYPRSVDPTDHSTPAYRSEPALEIRNRDGNVVTIDVSVPYRIIPGQAHKIVEAGALTTYRDRVKTTVESVLREVLSELSNVGFGDTTVRLESARKALDTLNAKLTSFHVKADSVLIRRVGFQKEYEEKLQQKQFLTQKARLDEAETLRLREALRTGTIEKEIAAAEALSLAEWEKKTEILKQEYALQVATIQAEALQYSKSTKSKADAIHATKIAEGKLEIDNAEALLAKLRSEALATAGGRIYLAKLAAENLNIGRVTLDASDGRVPMILDLHRLSDLLVGEASADAPAPVTRGAETGVGATAAEGTGNEPGGK